MSDKAILTVNAGSSSIKFSVYEPDSLREMVSGQVDSLNPNRQTSLTIKALDTGNTVRENITANDH
ncbi:MAG: acetate kinase, partial [Pseudomonadota bacterium]